MPDNNNPTKPDYDETLADSAAHADDETPVMAENNVVDTSEKLDNDFDTPFSMPDDSGPNADETYPTQDVDVDSTEKYQEGTTPPGPSAPTTTPGV